MYLGGAVAGFGQPAAVIVDTVCVASVGVGEHLQFAVSRALTWASVAVGLLCGVAAAWWLGRLAAARLAFQGPELLAAVIPTG